MPVALKESGVSRSASPSAGRRKTPVFVLGCPPSGTTVLYHMLLSAGGFAVYPSEFNVFNLLAPRFNGMRSASDRRPLIDHWLVSVRFPRPGLYAPQIGATT